MTSPSPLLGQTIAGRFRLLRHIGGGGAGDVFEAEPADLPGRRVACKVMRPFGMDPAEDERRFLREVKNTLRLSHPHVVELFEAGALPYGRLWYTMELLRGRTLAAVARESPPPAVARVVRICCQVLEALAAVHALGMVHRDVKPENVFVTAGPDAREHAKLLDFGLAKIVGGMGGRSQHVTRAGLTSGTLAYMPKEQLMGLPLDARADIHALGATLFEALSGRPPVTAEGGEEAYRAIVKELPPALPGSPAPSPSTGASRSAAATPSARSSTGARTARSTTRATSRAAPTSR